MPHIHKLYDFVVSIFICHKDRVLLIYHKKYNEWLPIGGHIDLNEDPEIALLKEIDEESGLTVKILADKPKIAHPGVKPIWTPSYVDVHRITDVHKHIAFIYFGISRSDKVRLCEREHREFCWLTEKEIDSPKYALTRSIRFYCCKALQAAARAKR